MDHIFEQKLVRENHQLQFELVKLNKQIKQLQETVVGYEHMINELNLMGSIKTGTSQGYKTGGILGAAKGAVKGATRAIKHNVGQMSSIKDVVADNDFNGIGGARIRGVQDRARGLYMKGRNTMQSAENSVTDSGRTQPNASPTRLGAVVTARLKGQTPPTFDGARKPSEGLVNPTDVTVNSGQQSMYARGQRQSDRGLKASLNAGSIRRKVEVSEGIRRAERTDAARLKAANTLQQSDPQNNRVAGGIANLNLNTSYQPIANALNRGRKQAQTRLSDLTLASGRAIEKTSKSLADRAVRASERQAMLPQGVKDSQLTRVAGAFSSGISTRSPSPGDSARVNAQMAREGTLGRRVGRRVAASVATRADRKLATAEGQRAMAAKAKALGIDAGAYMKQQAQERKNPTSPPRIGFQS